MCNPPFFSSKQDMLATWDKSSPPSAVCTGAETEMITEGGDAGFVLKLVTESEELGDRIQWYTSMLGKLTSVGTVVGKLKERGCRNWAVGCLLTGGKTRRWVVGWSWSDFRPQNVSALCSCKCRVIEFKITLTLHQLPISSPYGSMVIPKKLLILRGL